MSGMRAHMSDGHLYAGSKIAKYQYNRYFLVSENILDEQVFFKLHDAENYCQKMGYNPDECIKTADPEVWRRCIEIARIKSAALEEQATILYEMVQACYKETERLAKLRDAHEATNKRNFDRELDQKNVVKSISKGSGLYEAYKKVKDRAWYYKQILLFAKKP